MDFTPAGSQQAVAVLAAEILTEPDPWKELARAGLLDASALGVLDLTVLLTEIGRRAPSRKALAALMTGALPVARWGRRPDLLAAVASGELILTAALREPSNPQPDPPATTLTDGKLSGTKVGVPYAEQSHLVLLPASAQLPSSGVALVDPRAAGVTLTRTPSASGEPEYTLRLDQAPIAGMLGGADCVRDLYQLATVGSCALADGAVAGALSLTRDHVATREQFGRPLAAFQAVSQQIADVYIASRTLHLATLSACWRLDAGPEIGPEMDPEMLTERHGAVYRDVVRRMGRDGWLGVGWPVRYGGRGFGRVEQQIFANEAARADVPLPAVTLQTVGPTLQEHGTPWQQEFFLPRILAGEVHFAIGYTEPEAGTDLASLRTRAVRDGEEYVVDGQKIFTTGAHAADYIWLACRTAPSRHKGITILIVSTSDPGFSWTPIITHDGAHHVNATYYSGVRVPARMRVGAENEGWRLITAQLNHERVMLGPAGRIAALHDRVRDWAAGRSLLTRPDVRRALARAAAVMRVNELLNWQVASSGGLGGVVPPGANRASSAELEVADASATKVFSSEQLQVIGQELAEVVGRHGDPAEPDTAALLTWLDVQLKRNTVLSFGGGANEIQRELIATAGLGLPRAPRGGDRQGGPGGWSPPADKHSRPPGPAR